MSPSFCNNEILHEKQYKESRNLSKGGRGLGNMVTSHSLGNACLPTTDKGSKILYNFNLLAHLMKRNWSKLINNHNGKLSSNDRTLKRDTWRKRICKFLPSSMQLCFAGVVHFLLLFALQILSGFWLAQLNLVLFLFLTKWLDLSQQLLSPIRENQELLSSLDEMSLWFFCCQLQWLNLIVKEI